MVFSGIVEEMGSVVSLEQKMQRMWDGVECMGTELTIRADKTLEGVKLGDSIAVNGTCLTITVLNLEDKTFAFGCSPETLRRTNLGDLKVGDPVNLERGLASGDRNSGHYVQGHVDDTGKIEEFRQEGDSLWVKISASPVIISQVVPKGYVAVDGTSLTVCEVNNVEHWFNLMLIPFTQQHVIMPRKAVGARVNLETDVIAKYVQKSMEGMVARMNALEKQNESLLARMEAAENK